MAITFNVGDGNENIDGAEYSAAPGSVAITGKIDNWDLPSGDTATVQITNTQTGVITNLSIPSANINTTMVGGVPGPDYGKFSIDWNHTGLTQGEVYTFKVIHNDASIGVLASETKSVTVDQYFGLDFFNGTLNGNPIQTLGVASNSMNENGTTLTGDINILSTDLKNNVTNVLTPDGIPDNVQNGSAWDTFSISNVSPVGTSHGTLNMNADGTYSYTLTSNMDYLAAGASETDEFMVTVTDIAGNTVLKSLKIQIIGQNDGTVAVNDSYSVFENGDVDMLASTFDPVTGAMTNYVGTGSKFLNVLANDTDVDAGTVLAVGTHDTKVTKADGTKAGTIAMGTDPVTGKPGLVFTPGADFDYLAEGESTTVTFNYKSNDGSGSQNALSNEATVTLNIVGKNDALIVNADILNGDYNDLKDGDLWSAVFRNDTDADLSDTKTITGTLMHDLTDWQTGGSVQVNNGGESLAYVPGAQRLLTKDNFQFYYQATDGSTDPLSAPAKVEVDIKNADGDSIEVYQFGTDLDNDIWGTRNNDGTPNRPGSGKSDLIAGLAGNDYIDGGGGADILYGGEGQDSLWGGAGNDVLQGGKGNDALNGGEGSDIYAFEAGDGRGTITDVDLQYDVDAAGHQTFATHPGIPFPFLGGSHDHLIARDDTDTIELGNSVNRKDIAFFKNSFGALEIMYSENDADKIIVGDQFEAHTGIEVISQDAFTPPTTPGTTPVHGQTGHTAATMDLRTATYNTNAGIAGAAATSVNFEQLIDYISKYDLDQDLTNGVGAAQNVQDVQGNTHLMTVIATGW